MKIQRHVGHVRSSGVVGYRHEPHWLSTLNIMAVPLVRNIFSGSMQKYGQIVTGVHFLNETGCKYCDILELALTKRKHTKEHLEQVRN